MVTGDEISGGEQTMLYTGDILQNCTLETYTILLANVTPINLIKKTNNKTWTALATPKGTVRNPPKGCGALSLGWGLSDDSVLSPLTRLLPLQVSWLPLVSTQGFSILGPPGQSGITPHLKIRLWFKSHLQSPFCHLRWYLHRIWGDILGEECILPIAGSPKFSEIQEGRLGRSDLRG